MLRLSLLDNRLMQKGWLMENYERARRRDLQSAERVADVGKPDQKIKAVVVHVVPQSRGHCLAKEAFISKTRRQNVMSNFEHVH